MPLVVARVPNVVSAGKYAEYCVVGHGRKIEKWVRWSTFKTLMCELKRTRWQNSASTHWQVHAWRLGDPPGLHGWLTGHWRRYSLLVTSFVRGGLRS